MTNDRPFNICNVLNVNVNEVFNWEDLNLFINDKGEIRAIDTDGEWSLSSGLIFSIINRAYNITHPKTPFNEGERYILKLYNAKWISRDADNWEDTIDLWDEKPEFEDEVYCTKKYPMGLIETLPAKLFPTITEGELRKVDLNV